jgi:NitT/TauT family transport system ATP-binding protein
VAQELRVPFPHPRNRHDLAFRKFVDDIYALMTRRATSVPSPTAADAPAVETVHALYPVGTNLLAGLMETLAADPYRGRADLPPLAAALQLELDELLPLGETLHLLGFAELEEGDIKLTASGRQFADADADERTALFSAALLARVKLASTIKSVLDERWNHRASAVRFRDELEDHMSPDYAEDTLRAVIGWARFADLFNYDEEGDQFFLELEE